MADPHPAPSSAGDGSNPPAPVRGRPRSTSISSGSPNPAPGAPLPSLALPPTGWSFGQAPSNSPSPSPSHTASPSHPHPHPHSHSHSRSTSLSVPLVAPSPLSPGRLSRHRRTQSVSPPAFPFLGAPASTTDAPTPGPVPAQLQPRNTPDTTTPQSALTRLVIGAAPPPQTSTATATATARQSSPRSPTGRALPRSRTVSSPARASGAGAVPGHALGHARSPSHGHSHTHGQGHGHGHGHGHAHHHHDLAASHAALLQGVRSHHSPGPDSPSPSSSSSSSSSSAVPTPIPGAAPASANGRASPLTLGGSPGSPAGGTGTGLAAAHAQVRARRLSAGAGAGARSPPFGPSTAASPFALRLQVEHSDDACALLDEAMAEELRLSSSPLSPSSSSSSEAPLQLSSSPPLAPLPDLDIDIPHPLAQRHPGGRRPSAGTVPSPPLLPFDLVPSPVHSSSASSPSGTSPVTAGTTRPRSGSASRAADAAAVGGTASPASLYLCEPSAGEGAGGDSPMSPPKMALAYGAGGAGAGAGAAEEHALALLGPVDSTYPTRGALPAPSSSPPPPPRTGDAERAPSPPQRTSSPRLRPASPLLSLSPSPSASPSLPSRPHSPRHPPVPLPLPLPGAPSPPLLPAHPHPHPHPPPLMSAHDLAAAAVRARSRSRSRSRSKSRSRSRSRSPEPDEADAVGRDEGALAAAGAGEAKGKGKGTGKGKGNGKDAAAYRPRVHSPLALASASVGVGAMEERGGILEWGVVEREGETETEAEAEVEMQEDKHEEKEERPGSVVAPREIELPTRDPDARDGDDEGRPSPMLSPGLGLGGLPAGTWDALEPPRASPSSSSAPAPAPALSLSPPHLAPLRTSAHHTHPHGGGADASPIGTPEHLETTPTASPTEPHSSYFALPARGGDAAAGAHPPLVAARAGSDGSGSGSGSDEEDDEDEEDDPWAGYDDWDGSGETGGPRVAPVRRRSSGARRERERRSLLEELGISGPAEPALVSSGEEGVDPKEEGKGAKEQGVGAREEASGGEGEERDGMDVDRDKVVDAPYEGAEEAGQGARDEDEGMFDGEGDEDDALAVIDEDKLSALERIFVCAKSDALEDRARVAHFLPEWLPGVDICEAVEYVLPLLAGLIEEEPVKEVLAPKLDHVMWHFFSNCPLAELDASSSDGDGASSSAAASPDESAPQQQQDAALSSVETSPTSSHQPLSEASTPPTTSKPSPSGSDTPLPSCASLPTILDGSSTLPSAPSISATAFTSLLGALLTDQSAFVAKATEAALVRFLCRLKDRPLPPPPSDTEPTVADFTFGTTEPLPPPAPAGGDGEGGDDAAHRHARYELGDEARQILEDEIVCGIVLGLSRLDQEDNDDDERASAAGSASATGGAEAATTSTPAKGAAAKREGSAEKDDEADEVANPTLFLSPEEEPLDEAWLAGLDASSSSSEGNSGGDEATATSELVYSGWGAPLQSRGDDDTTQAQDAGASSSGIVPADKDPEPGDLSFHPPSPPSDPMGYSSFSPDLGGNGADEEASIGKMVAMSLVAAIAHAECLDGDVFADQFLPEVARMKDDGVFYVRKEAVQALGSLAKCLPVETVEGTALPLYDAYCRDDMWHVRRAAVLALPSLCKCLPRPSLRSQAVKAIVQFGADDNRNVRSGALEVCGELVYLFHEDPDGVPDELLAFFLGKPSSSSSADSPSGPADRAPLPLSPQIEVSPLVGGLDSPPTALLEASQTWSPVRPWPASRDPDREILTAFNFPAVVLTLGRSNWHLLRDAHRTLCQDHVEKVRQSLASSLHEVAKIIGPEQSDQALLEPLSWFLHDGDNIQAAVLETLPSLLASFTPGGAARALAVVADAWGEIRLWRQREHIAGQLAEVWPGFMNGDGADAVLGVLVKAFKDSVAAVREQAVLVVPPVLEASLAHPVARNKLLAFLFVFSSDSSYRNRSTYVSAALACVRAEIGADLFEEHLLPTLSNLARDKVVSVRIAVGRVIGEACRTATLYADISSRHPVRDLITVLGESPDRDVRQPVADFYAPLPRGWDEDPPAATPARPASRDVSTASVGGEDSLMSDAGDGDDDDDVPTPFSPGRAAAAAAAAVPLPPPATTGEGDAGADADDFDVDMAELDDAEPVLLERPTPESPVLLGRDGDEDFVEVERA